MSRYTLSIRDILRANAGNDDITTLAGTYAIAMRAIFSNEGLAPIIPDFRENLVVSFCRHYQNDEIIDTNDGTLESWRMLLDGKLWENAEYINAIYRQLDNQIFSQYRITSQDGQTHTAGTGITNSDDISTADTFARGKVIDNDATTDINNANRKATRGTAESHASAQTASDDTLNTTDDTSKHSAVSQQAGNDKSNGGETVNGTKSELSDYYADSNDSAKRDESSQSGAQHAVDERNDRKNNRSNDELDITNGSIASNSETTADSTKSNDELSVSTNQTKSQSESDTGSTTSEQSSHTQDDNGVAIQFDTPQGALSNLRSPGGDARGQGVSYADRQTYNYMTAAQETDASSVTADSHTASSTGKDVTDRKDDTDSIAQRGATEAGSTHDITDKTDTNATTAQKGSTEVDEGYDIKTHTSSDESVEVKASKDDTTHADRHTDGHAYDENQNRQSNGANNSESLTVDDSKDSKATTSQTASNKIANDNTTAESLSDEAEASTDTATHAGTRESNSDNLQSSMNTASASQRNSTTGYTEAHNNAHDRLMTWEVLHRSENILNRLWEKCFDDLFLAIFN